MTEKFSATIVVRGRSERARVASTAEPLSMGLPLGRGLCIDETALRLLDIRGCVVPLQVRVLERWPDSSIKWVFLDFQHRGEELHTRYTLSAGGQAPAEPDARITIASRDGGFDVDTGGARFGVDRSAFPFLRVASDGHEIMSPGGSVLNVEDADGRIYIPRIDGIRVEEDGPLRSVLCLSGVLADGTNELLELEARVHFFAGLSAVRIALTLTNPRRAEHTGGFWELGDAGSVLMRRAALQLTLAAPSRGTVLASAEPGQPFRTYAGDLELYQDSSGGENWMSPVHVNREGRVPNSFRGYRVRAETGEHHGLRATPHVAIIGERASVSIGVPHFWQNFPKAIQADGRTITLSMWPAQYGDVHELQGGEQKTHVFAIHFGGPEVHPESADWIRQPSTVAAEPEWYSATGAVPFLRPAGDDPAYEGLISAAIDGPSAFERKREIVDEYGWRHYGDLWADHEAVFQAESGTFVSHYNNQYDAIGGFAAQFMRTGNARWWTAMDELAAHVVDIDIYHTQRDKAAYNGGLFWHTCHHIPAGRSTHRSYPKATGTDGGGPGNEHNYSSGLVLHYFLTGSPLSFHAAVSLARWVMEMDNGRRTPFALLSARETGFASSTDNPGYHGPGRGSAYSVQALLDGFRLTGERAFMEKAEQLIRRCIHPDDDVAARDLLDVEPKWSYTVFLQMLGRYLESKRERSEYDAMYAYARDTLLQYARWMVEHETPYLETPERLEFPNETWVAQDVRKSEVFDYAARHTQGAERARFLEKAEYFWRYANDTLTSMPTRTLTRPVVLMLGHGLIRSHMRLCPAEQMPQPLAVAGHPPRVAFVPQKARAKARLLSLVGAGTAAVVALLIRLLW